MHLLLCLLVLDNNKNDPEDNVGRRFALREIPFARLVALHAEESRQHTADMCKQARFLRFVFFRMRHQKTKRSGSGALISGGRAVSKSSSR